MTWEDKEWYEDIPLSKNKIGSLMSTLLKEANLDTKYTNHCVQATVITKLDNLGYEARHIMTVSGHKKVKTIQSYATKTCNDMKQKMSNSLSEAMVPEKKHTKQANPVQPSTSTADTVQSKEVPNFNLSLKDLLELTPKEEQNLLKELVENDMENNENTIVPSQNILVASNVNNNNNIQNNHPMQSVMPKMLFNNPTITINFNLPK